MKTLITATILIVLMAGLFGQATASPTGYSGIPTFSIVSVVSDDTVTIQTHNFPADDHFTVRMGAFGTRGVNGIIVTTIDSGNGGAFTATYDIPAALAGSYRIAIRLESSTSGYYAYNWFYNDTTANTATPGPTATPKPTATPGGPTSTPAATATPAYLSHPTFSIVAVERDKSVTIKTNNLPSNDTFTVTMGAYGTKGINGVVVATTASGSGGTQTLTYDIPASLAGSHRIAIRMQSPTSGYYAYNWFYNNTYP